MPSPLGDKIRALRKQKKLSLEQLAELTDSSKSYIWELENRDTRKPSGEKLTRIAQALEVVPLGSPAPRVALARAKLVRGSAPRDSSLVQP